jgi:hypothetical protein
MAQAAGRAVPKIGPLKQRGLQVLRTGKGGGKAKAGYLTGALLGTAGGVALGTAVTNSGPRRHRGFAKRDQSASTFLGSGLQGTKDALQARGANLREKKPHGTYVVPLAVGTGAAAAGSHGTHAAFHALDRARKVKGLSPSKLRTPAAAVAGATLAIGSFPVSNKLLHHTNPGYKVTATGVVRTKKPPVLPSSKASQHEGRSSRGADAGAFRRAVVGKMSDPSEVHVNTTGPLVLKKRKAPVAKLFGKPHGAGMTREETLHQIHAKRRKLVTDTASTGLGVAGVGLLAARHAPRLAHVAPKLERAAVHTAIARGGVAAVGGVQGVRVTRRDLHAQERALKVPVMKSKPKPKLRPENVAKMLWMDVNKATGLSLRPVTRASFIKPQRLAGGIIRQTRVKASVA